MQWNTDKSGWTGESIEIKWAVQWYVFQGFRRTDFIVYQDRRILEILI